MFKNKNLATLGFLFLVAAAVAIAVGRDGGSSVAAGKDLYVAHCAACHGSELEGEENWRQRDAEGYLPAPPHDETGHTWHHEDDLLFRITKYSLPVVIDDPDYKTHMPAYDGVLTDTEILAVLAYIKSTWPREQRDWQAQMNSK